MMRFLPLALAFLVIGGVAVFDGVLNHRWVPNTEAEEYSELLKSVPENIGPWKGQSYEVDDDILKVAGAEGYVSRAYTNEETNETVKIWLIVGPFKHVIRHTPNICYPSQEFKQGAPIEGYSLEVEGEPDNRFLTSFFEKQGLMERVFWSWHKPSDGDEVVWYAGGDRENRERYAGTSALFKLYFTTTQPDRDTPPQESAANEFAKVFLPVLSDLILAKQSGKALPAAEAPAADEPAEDAQGDS